MASTNTYWLDVDPASGSGGGEVTVDAQVNTVTSDERGSQLVVRSTSGIVKRIGVTQDGGYVFVFDKTNFAPAADPSRSVANSEPCKRTVTKLAIPEPITNPQFFTVIRIYFYKGASLVYGREVTSLPWEENILPVAPNTYDRLEVEINYAKASGINTGSFGLEFTFDSGPVQDVGFVVMVP